MKDEWKLKECSQVFGFCDIDIIHVSCKFTSRYKCQSATTYWEDTHCTDCNKPIPKYILFQWKLLNGK